MTDKTLEDFKDTNVNNKWIASAPSISFAGCGFLSYYYLGVTACLQKYGQINDSTIVCGASSGAVMAVVICTGVSINESTTHMLELSKKVSSKPFGMLHPSFDFHNTLYHALMDMLPDDCHKKATGRLHISVTRVSDGENVLISQFDSKEDLINAIQCSGYLPFVSGVVPPKFKGTAYIDGAFSDNAPKLTDNTITVSPWKGEFDICPINDTSLPNQLMFCNKFISLLLFNVYRITQMIFPPAWDMKTKFCQQGFNDALRYLLRSNKICCNQCLKHLKSITSYEDFEEYKESSDSGYDVSPTYYTNQQLNHPAFNCTDCKNRREVAVNDSLPDTLSQAIEEHCHQFNQQLINKLTRLRPIKLLVLLFLPFLLLIELIIVIIFVIFTNQWSYEVLTEILNILKIITGLGLRDQKLIIN